MHVMLVYCVAMSLYNLVLYLFTKATVGWTTGGPLVYLGGCSVL